MSLECSECEHDLRGPHDPSCSRYRPDMEDDDGLGLQTPDADSADEHHAGGEVKWIP